MQDFTMSSENISSETVVIELPSMSSPSNSNHRSLESPEFIPLTNNVVEEYNETEEEIPRIHQVAQEGNVRRLKALLKKGEDPSQVDKLGRTPLHYAASVECRCTNCLSNAETCTKLLINTQNVNVNAQDNDGNTPLHLAIHNQQSKCAEQLISAGADVCLNSASGEEPVSLLVKKLPNTMIYLLDECIFVDQHDPSDEQCVLKVDFSPLVGKPKFKTSDGRTCSSDACTDNPKDLHVSWQREMKLLLSILENPATCAWRSKILTHPVIQIFMEQEWKRARKFFVSYFALYILYVISYTSYIIDVYLYKCPSTLFVLSNSTIDGTNEGSIGLGLGINDSRFNRPTASTCEIVTGVDTSLAIILTLTILLALMELGRLVITRQIYIRSKLNLGTWIFILLVFLTTIPNLARQTGIEPRQYQAAALTVFLAWAFMLQQIARFPSLGRYIEMFGVLRSFGFFILTFISLLIAFAIAFCIVFPTRRAFQTAHRSLLKTLVMMTGEMDYNTMFYTYTPTEVKGSFMGHILFVGFALIVSIVLMNLVIGLTVQDIQQLQADGELRRTSRLILEIHRLECFIFSKRIPRVVGNKLKESVSVLQPSKQNRREGLIFQFRPNSREDESVPEQLKQQALQLASISYERFRARRCGTPSYAGDRSNKFQADSVVQQRLHKQQHYSLVALGSSIYKGGRKQCPK